MYRKKHTQFPRVGVQYPRSMIVGGVGIGVYPSYMNITGSGMVDQEEKTETSQTPAESLSSLTGTDMSETASSNNSGAGSAAGAGVTGAGGSGVA
jgi:hypothetical protein